MVNGMYDGHWFGFGGGFMWIVWLVILVAIVWVIRSAVSGGGDAASSTRESALEILKARYARGEISLEEYRRMREELEK